jgi:hypothetical protein
MDALEAAEQETGIKFENFGKFSGEYNPLDLFNELEDIFGPGYHSADQFFRNPTKQ